MKVKCLHGYFIFEETKVGQVSDFMAMTGFSIVPFEKYYTFESIAEAPDFSLKGGGLLTAVATKTFAGKPWEVFEANGVVYDFSRDAVVPIASISQSVSIRASGNRFYSPGLLLPGSVTEDGSRVKDYAAWYSRDTQRWLYSEVSYV